DDDAEQEALDEVREFHQLPAIRGEDEEPTAGIAVGDRSRARRDRDDPAARGQTAPGSLEGGATDRVEHQIYPAGRIERGRGGSLVQHDVRAELFEEHVVRR